MTARVSLSCDGAEGIFPCRQAVPVGEPLTGAQARAAAKKHFGWSSEGDLSGIRDYCERCTHNRQREQAELRARYARAA